MRAIATAAGLTVFLLLAGAMSQPGPSAPPDYGPPCLTYWMERGRSNGARVVLFAAAWVDGTVLVSGSRTRLGENLVVMRTDPRHVESALERIRESGVFDLKTTREGVPDASHLFIVARDGGREARLMWHGSLLPGFGSNGQIKSDDAYRKLVAAFLACEGAITSLPPESLESLATVVGDKPSFRGFNLEEPWRTAWLRDR